MMRFRTRKHFHGGWAGQLFAFEKPHAVFPQVGGGRAFRLFIFWKRAPWMGFPFELQYVSDEKFAKAWVFPKRKPPKRP